MYHPPDDDPKVGQMLAKHVLNAAVNPLVYLTNGELEGIDVVGESVTWEAHVVSGTPAYTYEWSIKEEGDPGWTTVGENSATWQWDPVSGDVGTYAVRCSVTDSLTRIGEVIWEGFEVFCDLCEKIKSKHQTCLEKQSEGRELDYDTCKNVCKDSGSTQGECEGNGCFWDAPKSKCRAAQGPCEAAGCTFNKNSPTQAYPCMLDMCLSECIGDAIVGGGSTAISAREAGRGGCP
jgi:hypothetical protein